MSLSVITYNPLMLPALTCLRACSASSPGALMREVECCGWEVEEEADEEGVVVARRERSAPDTFQPPRFLSL